MSDTPALLQEQYRDLEQQHQTAQFGMWVFLASEILFFGALFLSLTVYRTLYTEAFREGAGETSLFWGTLNTAVLLTSSLAMAFAVHNVREGKWRRARRELYVTVGLGALFLSIKAHEYSMDIHNGFFPNSNFNFSHFSHAGVQLFFAFYFTMTAVHALHMVIGIAIVTLFARRLRRQPERSRNAVEIVGLYWHFVDIVWVFLYPMLYLIGRNL